MDGRPACRLPLGRLAACLFVHSLIRSLSLFSQCVSRLLTRVLLVAVDGLQQQPQLVSYSSSSPVLPIQQRSPSFPPLLLKVSPQVSPELVALILRPLSRNCKNTHTHPTDEGCRRLLSLLTWLPVRLPD